MLIAGLAAKKDVLVRDDYTGASVQIAPLVGQGTTGIALTGSM
jgi:hypothetical protein